MKNSNGINVTPAHLMRMFGRTTAYARQLPPGSKVPYFPVDEEVTVDLIRKHMAGEVTLGTYTNDGDQAKALVFDIDMEGNLDAALEEADKIVQALTHLGIPLRGISRVFSGGKGYHVWVLFAAYTEAARFRRLGRAVLALSGVKCEVFPKQDRVKEGKYGNLVKMPEGIQLKTGKRAEFLDAPPSPLSLQILDDIIERLPEEAAKTSSYVGPDMYPCFTAIQEGPGEGWRNNGLYHGCVMGRKGGLIEEDLVDAVHNKWNARAKPEPLDTDEVDALIESSKEGGPKCDDIPDEFHCGEFCVKVRHANLFTRRGEFKFAQEGELKVVEVKKRDGKLIELAHPDIAQGKVVIE